MIVLSWWRDEIRPYMYIRIFDDTKRKYLQTVIVDDQLVQAYLPRELIKSTLEQMVDTWNETELAYDHLEVVEPEFDGDFWRIERKRTRESEDAPRNHE